MIETGSINYDVPVGRTDAYSKLRSLFKRKAIMQTASSYLFPWSLANTIKQGIDKLNCDKDGLALPAHLQIKYSIFKYDINESGKAIEQSAEDALRRMLRNVKELVNKRMQLLFSGEANEDMKDPLVSAKSACKKARDTLRDAKTLAMMFNLTDQLEVGFLAYESFIEAKKLEITDWETTANQQLEIFEANQNVQPIN